jgi:dihydroorotate dehydrogenase electron transfer subunit
MSRRDAHRDRNRRQPTLREAVLTAHRDAGEGTRSISLSCARWEGQDPVPGQFLMARVAPGSDPLLHRPFGFAGFSRRGAGAEFEIWFRVVGRGTALMAGWAAGEHLLFAGPLGRGFPLPEPGASPGAARGATRGERSVLVAGGMGFPPLLFLARALAQHGALPAPLILYGGRTRRGLAGLEAFAATGAEVLPCTEDGSHGARGMVTSLLEERDLAGCRIYACGPAPMLAAVRRIALARALPVRLSLEARMACGFGVCAGCAVRTVPPPGWEEGAPHYQRICREGPVFDGAELVEESFTEAASRGSAPGCRP